MTKDELIKRMKDDGISVVVDNGNKLEFSNGETYVKDSHSEEYKRVKNYMESIKRFVESKLFEDEYNNESENDGWDSENDEDIVDILEVLEDFESLKYELQNTIRGAYTNANNKSELASYINGLIDRLNMVVENLSED